MALLAVVDALEHAIFTAVAANSPYGACRAGEKERGATISQPVVRQALKKEQNGGYLEACVTSEVDCDVWCGGRRGRRRGGRSVKAEGQSGLGGDDTGQCGGRGSGGTCR